MSTTSTNFHLILASSADLVAVDSHIANNFSTLDSILAVSHTGSGQLKMGLSINSPTLMSPIVSGSMSGAVFIGATTGKFNTITATGGFVILSSMTASGVKIGTYSMPATIGATNQILTVQTGNAVWAANSPGTGANTSLSNLSSVALNAGLGTGSGGFFTLDRIVASSGALTGLTTFRASTGTFTGNVTITGTVTANAVNCTGGSITAGGITIGTYALPSTIGVTGQVLTVKAGPVLAFQSTAGYSIVSTLTGNGSLTFSAMSSGLSYIFDYSIEPKGANTGVLISINTGLAFMNVEAYGILRGVVASGTGVDFISTFTTGTNSITIGSCNSGENVVGQICFYQGGPSRRPFKAVGSIDGTNSYIVQGIISTSAPVSVSFQANGTAVNTGFVTMYVVR